MNDLIISEVYKSILNARLNLSAGETLSKILVAVSGGIDSVTLLHSIYQLKKKLDLQLAVIHVDHKLRLESPADALFVEKLAKSYELPFYLYVAPDKPRAENLESWARERRYNFFREAQEKFLFDVVITAHNQNDQAETLLDRLLNGRLATDPRCIAFFQKEKRLLRPLLNVSRQEIEKYAKENSLNYVVDHTNFNIQRTRNRIRHQLIPNLIKEFNPRLVESLSILASKFSVDENALWQEAERVKLSVNDPAKIEFVLQQNIALRWRILKLIAINQVGAPANKLGYRSLNHILLNWVSKVIVEESAPWGPIDIGHGITGSINADRQICFTSKVSKDFKKPFIEFLNKIDFDVPGSISWISSDNYLNEIEVQVLQNTEGFLDKNSQCLSEAVLGVSSYFDWDLLRDKHDFSVLTKGYLRGWHQGDRMNVWKRGHRKVKKLFQEKRVPLEIRRSIPVLVMLGEILWIPGVARANLAPVTPETKTILKFSYKKVLK